ncbi:MAG: hydrogenase/urease maturation nickel metallochaperone HypA [Pseudomonadota bacterium]
MHEASLMKDLMDKILSIVETEKGDIVTVSVWLGALSHMSPDHFREHYEQAAAGTAAEGARLDIETSFDLNDANAQNVVLKSVEISS